jgi:hypothetical protein
VFSGQGPISPESVMQTPRLNLRKRACEPTDKVETNLVSVNSAFLSGLFADVAAAQVEPYEESCDEASSPSTRTKPDARVESNLPNKKTRLSLHRAMSRCGKSYCLLGEAAHSVASPTGAMTTFFDDPAKELVRFLGRQDSLHFQLNCVSDFSADNSASDAASVVFPHLPATISNSSCVSSLTRSVSDLQDSVLEINDEKDSSYGWFVEMEDDDRQIVDPYTSSKTSSLAFTAPTAPKASNYDAELEWAQAADTVDDVLGDFF